MQRARRTNPYPFSWEVPVAVALAVVLLLVVGIHAGRAAANVTAGGGLGFPAREDLFASLAGVLSGDAGAGLSPRPVVVADAARLWLWVAVVELITVALLCWAGKALWGRWGPGRVRGMATRAEAQALLGRARLRRAAPIIRPDLYGRGPR